MITTNKFQLDKKLMASLFGEELVALHYPEPNKNASKSVTPNFKTDISSTIDKQPKPEIKQEPVKEKVITPILKPCSCSEFVGNVIRLAFGMGKDYAMKDDNGNYLKAWFTVDEAVEAASAKGYTISKQQAQAYLDFCVKENYFKVKDTLEGRKYQRRNWWGGKDNGCEMPKLCKKNYQPK